MDPTNNANKNRSTETIEKGKKGGDNSC